LTTLRGVAPLSVSVKAASELSGLSLRKTKQLVADGILASTAVGRRRLVSYQSLVDLVSPRKQTGVTGNAAEEATA
jgi:excisionase family DNA binding protein